MSKPTNDSATSTLATSDRANESATKEKAYDTMLSSSRHTYKPTIPWAFESPDPCMLTPYVDDDKKPPENPSIAVRIVRIHFLIKLPAILAITLALSCLPAAIQHGRCNDDGSGNTTAVVAPRAFLRNLLHGTWATLAFQAAVGVPSALLRTELLADPAGAIGFFAVVVGALRSTAGANRATAIRSCDGSVWDEIGVDWRQGWVTALVCVWAVRRAIFTFVRALCRNGDSRFDRFRADRKQFFTAFMMQSILVIFRAVPVIALNSIPVQGFIDASWEDSSDLLSTLSILTRTFWFWLGLWAFFRGFMIECVADWQLTKWRLHKYWKRHDEVFCKRGLWERSRHPNYYGEWLLWLGISLCCSAVLLSPAARNTTGLGFGTASLLCAMTPYFVYKTLHDISIPLIEEKYDKLYMPRKDYRDWRRNRTFRLWLDGSGIIWGYL